MVLAVGDTRLACTSCGLAAPVSRLGTAPGTHAMVSLESDLTGTTLAGFKLVERIGAGGMGTVYRARTAEAADVAIKVLRPGFDADRGAMLARFAREAEALRRLEHAHVVRLHDHGEENGVAFIVTELVEGRDLAATLAAGRMKFTDVVDAFGQVCEGVAAAHAAGIVHRDLKPANILVGTNGAVKVADFGLAQLGADAAVPTLTRTDVAMGTFHYLAPEQRKDARAVDHRADVWALGVILYEMLTGELPLGSFAPPSASGADRRADAIVRRALAPDPADRYATVDDLARAVRALHARPAGSRRWIAIAAAAFVTAATAATVAMATSGGGERVTAIDAAQIAIADASLDAAIDAAQLALLDAPVDAAQLAMLDASIDAPRVAAVTPKPPTPVVKRPTKPVKLSGGKSQDKPDVQAPPICWSARRCCQVVKGGNCGSWLDKDATTCATGLGDLRALATNPKQQAACR
ncbi:MAG: serine/threonine protein kinase [Myxococcota bacterium]|nr:serine/threonine protein kinase [Myxococcota bacterium]